MFDDKMIKRDYPLTDIFQRLTGHKLKRAGRNYRGICVFHNEKNASFNIFEDNHYKCFGCNKSGNNIDFVMNYCNTDFKTACEIITGNIQAREPKRLKGADPCEYKKQEITETTKVIYQFFYDNLVLTERGRQYLYSRCLNEYIINEYQIKSLDHSQEIIKKLKSKFSTLELRASGLFNDRNIFIFLKPCIIIPIFNNDREPVYFSNRFINEDRYRFMKLTGIKQRYLIGNLENEYIFIFESFFDAVSYRMFTPAGLDNFIITFGQLSENTFKEMLRDYTDKKFIIALDNDKTGIETTNALLNIDPERSARFDYEDFRINKGIKSKDYKDFNDLLRLYTMQENELL